MKRDAQPLSFDTAWRKSLKHAIWIGIAFWTGGAWIMYYVDAPTVTIECRYEDWTDLLGGREHPLKLAALRRLRPKGDLRWLWRARKMFPQ